MSIAIVSSLPQSMPNALPESSAEEGAALDFGALLLGQLLPLTVQTGVGAEGVQDALPGEAGAGQETAEDAAAFVIPFLSVTEQSISLANASKVVPEGKALSQETGKIALSDSLSYGDTQKSALTNTELKQGDQKTDILTTQPVKPDDVSAKFAVKMEAQTTSNEGLTSANKPLAEQTQPIATFAAEHKAPAEAVRTPVAAIPVATPFKDPSWQNDFGQKIVWMAHNDKQSAQLVLNPPELGRIEVSLNIDKAGASATFVSASADVRESIEAALPRLREMFAGAGIELGQANVSSESFKGQEQSNAQSGFARSPETGDSAILEPESVAGLNQRQQLIQGNGMVDTFV